MATGLKKHSHKILMFCLTAILCFGCSEENLKNLFNNDKTVEGLKAALTVGIENSVDKVRQPGGYLNDIIKINLPEGAQSTFAVINALQGNPVTNALLSSLNIQPNLENTLTVLINSAAEDAAPKSVDIFTKAIKNMTIEDGKTILFGTDHAATEYLERETYTQLQGAFEPSITASLNTVNIAGTTPVQAWQAVANINNSLSDLIDSNPLVSGALSLAKISLKPMEPNLSNYVTGKALDGLFIKVADEELKIRTDVDFRVTPLLREIFGQLDNNEE